MSHVQRLSAEVLSELSGPLLVTYYNGIAEILGNTPPVKKFRDKSTAVKRCLKIQEDAALLQTEALEPLDSTPETKTAYDASGAIIIDDLLASDKPMTARQRVYMRRAAKKIRQLRDKTSEKKTLKIKRGKSIKTTVLDMITSDKEDDEIISTIQANFPESKFNSSHISWYRSTLFRDGVIGPEHAPRRTQAYKNWKKGLSE